MDRFLEEQIQAGVAESSGGFTLDPEQARIKIQAYALARPGQFILKLVQAAVAAGSERIEVTFERDSMRFSFQLADPTPFLAERVAAATLRLGSLPSSPVRHLAVGLSVASASAEETRWQTPEGCLVIDRESMRCDTGRHYPEFTLVVTRERTLGNLFGTLFLQEYRELLERCQFAPVQLVVDGRPLERPLYDRYRCCYIKGIELPRLNYVLEHWNERGGGLWYRRPLGRAYSPLRPHFLWSGQEQSREPVGLLLMGASPYGDSEMVELGASLAVLPVDRGVGHVTFVKDGVTLDKWHGDLGHPAVSLICEAGELSVDLSEFKVLENQAFAEKLEELRGWVRATTEAVSEDQARKVLVAAGVEGWTLEHDVAYLYHWLQNHVEPLSEFHVRATKENIGLNPAFGERVLLSLPSMKRFALWVHFKCRAIATDRRLIFWNLNHPKHSWQLSWDEVARSRVEVKFSSDLHFITPVNLRRGAPLEMAFETEPERARMQAVIDRQVETTS